LFHAHPPKELDIDAYVLVVSVRDFLLKKKRELKRLSILLLIAVALAWLKKSSLKLKGKARVSGF